MLNEDFSAKIDCKIKRKKNKCPCCGKETDKVHDYREQTIKDATEFGKIFLIHLKRKRYRCSCGKKFYKKTKKSIGINE